MRYRAKEDTPVKSPERPVVLRPRINDAAWSPNINLPGRGAPLSQEELDGLAIPDCLRRY